MYAKPALLTPCSQHMWQVDVMLVPVVLRDTESVLWALPVFVTCAHGATCTCAIKPQMMYVPHHNVLIGVGLTNICCRCQAEWTTCV